jgi:hypothetical protein
MSVVIVVDVLDDLSALPPEVRCLALGVISRRFPSLRRPEPAVIARVHATEHPFDDKLDDPGVGKWLVALNGGPVAPGDIVDAGPGWATGADGGTASPAGMRRIDPTECLEHLVVVRRGSS